MSNCLAKYEKRICREFEFNGEQYAVRGLTNGEIARSEKLEKELKNSLFFGFGLIEADLKQVFTPDAGESDVAFATRVKVEMENVPLPMMRKLIDEIVKTTMPPADMDGFLKNSEQTAT